MLPDERVQNLRALAFLGAAAADPAGRATDAHFTSLFVDTCLVGGDDITGAQVGALGALGLPRLSRLSFLEQNLIVDIAAVRMHHHPPFTVFLTYFYIAELVQSPLLTAHYGSHHTKPVCMGIFKVVWWRASEQYLHHRDHCTEPTLRSNIDPNIPQRLLRP